MILEYLVVSIHNDPYGKELSLIVTFKVVIRG